MITIVGVPVPFQATPLTLSVLKVPSGPGKNELANWPPFSGETAMVHPVGVVTVQVVGEFAGGTVVFTMNAPAPRIGL